MGTIGIILATLLTLWGQNTGAAPAQRSAPSTAAQERGRTKPWLVTVMHHVAVGQLLSDLSREGWRVSVPDEITLESQTITNVTTGIVLDRKGRIIARLVNADVRTKPSDVVITTADGRTFHPSSVRIDESTGYAVLRVPGLKIEPPAFALGWRVAGSGERVRLLYNVPDKLAVVEALAEMERGEQAKLGKSTAGRNRQSSRPVRTKVRQDYTWVTVPDPPAVAELPETWQSAASSPPAAPPAVSDTAAEPARSAIAAGKRSKEFRPLEVASLTSETDGGVVLDGAGQVLGVAQFVPPDKGVLKSIDELRALVSRLSEQRPNAVRGWLGVRLASVEDLPAEEESRLKAPADANVVVKAVIEDGPAAKAGMKPNDVILSLNQKALKAPSELSEIISTLRVGTDVPVQVWRDGASQTLNVELASRPDRRSFPELGAYGDGLRERPRINEVTVASERSQRPAPTSAHEVLNRCGMQVDHLSPQLRSFFGLSEQQGVLVTEVKPLTAAHRAGLRAGDVIVSLNETDIATPRGLALVLQQLMSRRPIDVHIMRDRKPQRLSLHDAPSPAAKPDPEK